MSALSFLVRLILSAALIFNGSVGAMTDHARHMDTREDTRETVPEQDEIAAQAVVELPCHHRQGDAMRAVTSDTAVTIMGDVPHHAPDCCGSADCRSGCAQHCSAAIVGTAVVQGARMPRVGLMLSMQASHVSPALPHLIRPPIG